VTGAQTNNLPIIGARKKRLVPAFSSSSNIMSDNPGREVEAGTDSYSFPALII